MNNRNHRYMDIDMKFAAIRLARLMAQSITPHSCFWHYDWTPGPNYGAHRKTTISEKRVIVSTHINQARAAVADMRAEKARIDRAEMKFADELAALRQRRDLLQMQPFRNSIAKEGRAIDAEISALIASA